MKPTIRYTVSMTRTSRGWRGKFWLCVNDEVLNATTDYYTVVNAGNFREVLKKGETWAATLLEGTGHADQLN